MRLVRAESGGSTGAKSTGLKAQLPADIAEKVAPRLCWIALTCAVCTIAMFLLSGYLQPEAAEAQKRLFFRLNMVLLIGMSVGFIVADRRGVFTPAVLLQLGLAFQVVGAFALASFEYTLPVPPNQPVRGVSWVAVWICVCALLLPNTPARSTLAAFLSAAMGPVAYVVNSLMYGHPPLPFNRFFMLMFPSFLMAAWASFLVRRMYQLQADARKVKELGSYELVNPIAQGGMGEVWLARHRMLARAAAVKLIRPEVLVAQTGRQASIIRRRFEQEAHATAALRSPHTVALYDFGVSEEGAFYYVMELLEGLDLERLVKRFGPQPPARVIHILRQVCDSLAEAHTLDLVHRDIKPTNLFLCRLGMTCDFVKVLDFGLVKAALPDGESRMTLDGMTTGTPAYMAPETAEGHPGIDGRVDIYGLGCVAYWLLTGHLVFEESSPVATVISHVQKPPIPPSGRTELPIPASLEKVILACLEKKPENRPQSAQELARMLEGCAQEIGGWSQHDAHRWWGVNMPEVACAKAGDTNTSTATTAS